LVDDQNAVAVVAEVSGRPIGFATAVVSTSAFARRFYVRHGLAAAVAAAPALLRGGALRGIRESARYAGSGNGLPEAEIISIAVAHPWRRRGIARLVGEATLSALAALGAEETRVMIADDNDASNRLFARLGLPLRNGGRVAVHGRIASTVWVTKCRS
jgi:GNAT superfamily N-acetyltransferase